MCAAHTFAIVQDFALLCSSHWFGEWRGRGQL